MLKLSLEEPSLHLPNLMSGIMFPLFLNRFFPTPSIFAKQARPGQPAGWGKWQTRCGHSLQQIVVTQQLHGLNRISKLPLQHAWSFKKGVWGTIKVTINYPHRVARESWSTFSNSQNSATQCRMSWGWNCEKHTLRAPGPTRNSWGSLESTCDSSRKKVGECTLLEKAFSWEAKMYWQLVAGKVTQTLVG